MFLPPALAQALKCERLDELDLGGLAASIVGLDENEWLDVKVGPPADVESAGYRRYWRDLKAGLPADVSAFANRDGGLIVIGASEKDGIIAAVQTFALPPGEIETSLYSSLLGRLRPMAEVSILCLRNDDDFAAGIVLVLIQPGSQTPYATESGGAFTFYRRERRGNRFLAEPEVEGLYRARFEAAQVRKASADAVHDELVAVAEDLIPQGAFAGHLAVVGLGAVPARSGEVLLPTSRLVDRLRSAQIAAMSEAVDGLPDSLGWISRATRTGLRLATKAELGRQQTVRVFLGYDGSYRISWGFRQDSSELSDVQLAGVVALSLGLCVEHASRSGAMGDLHLVGQLHVPERGSRPLLVGTEVAALLPDADPWMGVESALRLSNSVAQMASAAERIARSFILQAMLFELSGDAQARISEISDGFFRRDRSRY